MGYSAGNLELSILGFSEKAVASIDVTAKALRRLASAVDKINNTQFVFAGQKLEVLFTKIAKATNSINTTNITNLASAAKSLSSISRLSNLDKMDFEKVGKGFETLSIAIQPFLNKVREAEASLTALDGILRRSSGKKIQGLLDADTSGKNNRGGLLGLAKIGITIHSVRRLGRFMGNLVQAGSDYYETLNLWQVAMRNNLDTADQFINKMNKAYGISTKTLMNAQAIFKNMIGSLGQISDATAYALSEALVQMSADFSSLYNVQLEKAFEKMQAMLAGQVRPIRSAGLDMTETTLFMFYQQLGGTKTMRQLNRTEKQLLSILAVYQQMGSAGALGDMTKTLNSFANQSRMMVEYWRELKAWSGLLIKDLLEEWQVLKYINAALITMTEIVKAIAKSRGLGEENFIDGMFESVEATNDAVDELQGKLLDFDKFRSLEGAGASPLAIDEKLLQAIAGYSSKISDAVNEAQLLAEQWMVAIGFTKDENGELVLTGENLEKVKSQIKSIAIALTAIAGLAFASSIANLFSMATNPQGLVIVIAGVAIWEVVNGFKEFTNGDIEKGLTKIYTALGLIGVALALITHSWIPLVATAIAGFVLLIIDNVDFFKTALIGLGNGLVFIGNGILNTWFFICEGIIGIVNIVLEAINAILVPINDLGKIFGANWNLKIPTIKYNPSYNPIPSFSTGASDIDSGTIFRAGEMGKTEAVYTGSNGKTNVANVRQMEQAFYNALSRYTQEGNGTIVVQAYLDGEKVYENTTARAKAQGKVWAKAQ